MKWRIPLIKSTVGQEELDAVKRVFESGMLTQGPETEQFEKEFAQYVGAKHAVASSSGTTALHLALLCCGVGKGDEVIVPDFTFPATGNVVFHCGAQPTLCDIRLKTFQIDPEKIEELITAKTKAIMPVSEFGLTADMKPIMELAERHQLSVVEDAAPAIGSRRWGKHAGTFGDAGCFSLHPRKLCGVGEGGMLVTDDKDLADEARCLRNHGQTSKWFFVAPGFNYRLSDVHSAIGRVQLQKLPETLKRRRELAERYNSIFKDWIPYVPPNCVHTYQSYVLLLNHQSTYAIAKMRKEGVEATIGTSCLHVLPPFHDKHRQELVNSHKAWRNSLTLPLYNSMTDLEQDTVIEEVYRALEVYPQIS